MLFSFFSSGRNKATTQAPADFDAWKKAAIEKIIGVILILERETTPPYFTEPDEKILKVEKISGLTYLADKLNKKDGANITIDSFSDLINDTKKNHQSLCDGLFSRTKTMLNQLNTDFKRLPQFSKSTEITPLLP